MRAEKKIQGREHEEGGREFRPGEGRVLDEQRIQHEQHGQDREQTVVSRGIARDRRALSTAKGLREDGRRQEDESGQQRAQELVVGKVDAREMEEGAGHDVDERWTRRDRVDDQERAIERPALEEEAGTLPMFEPVAGPAAAGVGADGAEPAHAPQGHDQIECEECAGRRVPGDGAEFSEVTEEAHRREDGQQPEGIRRQPAEVHDPAEEKNSEDGQPGAGQHLFWRRQGQPGCQRPAETEYREEEERDADRQVEGHGGGRLEVRGPRRPIHEGSHHRKRLYFTMAHRARKPSRHPIFFPSA